MSVHEGAINVTETGGRNWAVGFSVHCTLYYEHCTVHCALSSVLCTLYDLHFIMNTVRCKLSSVFFTLYDVHCKLYLVNCTLYDVHCMMYTVHCTLNTIHWAVYTGQCSEQYASYMHSALNTSTQCSYYELYNTEQCSEQCALHWTLLATTLTTDCRTVQCNKPIYRL